ncbi:putative transcriptional repressor [Rhizoctonia solani 123E]|uniref:Putative transcriptional repressor n=1 Tax=Rhizoctonia solani 123E TaxID=1423351 RepID=A0A074S464_9AGAM|nr:putative transcriptional repressor [Rhizoctonia solani 123E]
MNFFKAKQRTPSEIVRGLRDAINKLDVGPPGSETRRKASEDVTKGLQQVKGLLHGDGDPGPELVAQLATEAYAADLLPAIVKSCAKFDFEARKDAAQVFSLLLRRQIGSRSPTVEYIVTREIVVYDALKGYEIEEVALSTGLILREMLKHEPIARILLNSDQFYSFPHYIEDTTFGVSCDAFANLKETLTRHKPMVAEYLEANYDRFFTMYTSLLLSTNYVTKRQSLKLLGEILLDRANFNVMTRYIGVEANLKMMMNLLRDKSRNIQFEAFHVFKVFVANPKKPPQIETILRRNKDKLLVFLRDFHNDKEDEQFSDEKQFLISQIQAL